MKKNEDPIQSRFSSWDEFVSLLPCEWEELASRSGLLKGLRKDKNPGNILRTLMFHLLCGHSLRETAAISTSLGIAEMSDVAMLKRLRKSEGFLRMLCQSLMEDTRRSVERKGFRFRLIDGTDIKEPGQFGTLWRVHFSFSLPAMECDGLKLTKTTGEGVGEDLRQFKIARDDIVVADRGYCRPGGLLHVIAARGYFIVRLNTQMLRLCEPDGSPLDLGTLLGRLRRDLECLEARAVMKAAGDGQDVQLRLCAIRKESAAAEKARRKIRSIASKKQKTVLDLTLLAAGYVIVVTNLPDDVFPLKTVLECYRLRWQVELTFKRMKSLLKVGALPKYTDASSRAWLYGKLFIALLVEKSSSRLGAFSPWSWSGAAESIGESLVRLQLLAEDSEGVGGARPATVFPAEELDVDQEPD